MDVNCLCIKQLSLSVVCLLAAIVNVGCHCEALIYRWYVVSWLGCFGGFVCLFRPISKCCCGFSFPSQVCVRLTMCETKIPEPPGLSLCWSCCQEQDNHAQNLSSFKSQLKPHLFSLSATGLAVSHSQSICVFVCVCGMCMRACVRACARACVCV